MKTIDASRRLSEEVLPGGAMWSAVIRRHTTLRLTDLEGGANVSLMAYNHALFLDRLNLPDTLKAQHTAKLTTGFVLYSDMGRILFSITEDTVEWHDPLAGHSNERLVARKYGPSTYQKSRNGFYRNGRDQFLIEMAKWGLGKADLVANVNFFNKVQVDESGKLQWIPGHSKAGDYVDLRAEMDVLVILNSCPHPMEDSAVYAPKPVRLSVFRSDPPTALDPCRRARPENERGFSLTESLFQGVTS
jgi:urea carboxylase-associated protein 2